MSSTNYSDIMIGDTVYYSTPQGQVGKGKTVIIGKTVIMGDHGWVVNRGNGQPQVVTLENFVKFNKGRNRREDFIGKFLNGSR